MQRIISILFICLIATAGVTADAQQHPSESVLSDTVPFNRVFDINPRFLNNDSTRIYSGICKVLRVSKYIKGNEPLNSAGNHLPGITIHGNIFYDFLYRSYADTPYYQKDFREHTIRTSMDISVKDKYSFRLNLRVRLSNSPWFKNFFDGGLQFDRNTFLSKMKQRIEGRILENALQKTSLPAIEASLEEEIKKYNGIRSSLGRPDIAQLIIEEREKRFYKKVNNPQIAVNGLPDSSLSSAEQFLAAKRKELDSLQTNISALRNKVDSLKNNLYKEIALARQKIYMAGNPRDLKQVARENGLPDEKMSTLEKIIADTRSVGIGRSMVNYSELTANNVSLTGINIEYNPGIYAAVAAGKIDYGFRDFMGRNKSLNKQNLLMGRIGFGDKDRMAVILSVFTGKKYNYGSVLNDSINSHINVMGYSVEGILRKNENVSMSVEVAKSTRPLTGRLNDNKETGSLFRFDDHSNQAISIKAQTIIRETDTRLSGFYRKSGENFQSFSLFTYNTDQTAWLLKADQSFLKNKIGLILMLRRNDFVNPFTEKTFKTSTVFTSAQLSVRVPKWPSVTVGYYPGSQLYIIDKQRVRENVYYIMNGTITHNYSLAGIRMVTSAIYNFYSNKGTDSGFISYGGANYMLTHSLLFRKLQVSGNFIYTDQQELRYYTVEGNAEYFPVAFFKIGAGGKYNKTEYGKTYWGGQAQLMVEIKKLGGLQLQYEKSFLPTIRQTLFPVDIGRISWFKYF